MLHNIHNDIHNYIHSLLTVTMVKSKLINEVQQSKSNPAVISMRTLYPKGQPTYPAEAQAICADVADFFKAQGFNITHSFKNNSKLECSIKF